MPGSRSLPSCRRGRDHPDPAVPALGARDRDPELQARLAVPTPCSPPGNEQPHLETPGTGSESRHLKVPQIHPKGICCCWSSWTSPGTRDVAFWPACATGEMVHGSTDPQEVVGWKGPCPQEQPQGRGQDFMERHSRENPRGAKEAAANSLSEPLSQTQCFGNILKVATGCSHLPGQGGSQQPYEKPPVLAHKKPRAELCTVKTRIPQSSLTQSITFPFLRSTFSPLFPCWFL